MTPFAEATARTVTSAPGSTGLLVASISLLSTAVVGSTVVDVYRRIDRRFMSAVAPWIFIIVPGIALHELAHAAVGRRYASVTIIWDRPHVELDWHDEVPIWGVVATLFAPLVVGGFAAFALAVVVELVPAVVAVWLAINWLLLAGPSIGDVVALLLILEGDDA